MWSQGFSFMEREQKRFISYSLNNGDILVKTELEMLKNNNISGILPVSEIHDNNNVVLLYNINFKTTVYTTYVWCFQWRAVV